MRPGRPHHPAAGGRPRRADRRGRRGPREVPPVGGRRAAGGPDAGQVSGRRADAGAPSPAGRCTVRVLDVMQGTQEWEMARLGIPTASQADRILTPSRLQPAAAAREYLHQLLAEWLIGYPIEWSASSQYMQRGTDLEAEARAAYELEMGVDVQQVGLCVTDDSMIGGSPDGLVGDVGGVEIKCPAIHMHIGYLLDPRS